MRRRVEHAHVGTRAHRQVAGLGDADDLRRVRGDAGESLHQRQSGAIRPLQGQRQQQLEAGGAGLRLRERRLLAVVVHRGVIRAQRVDAALGQAAGQRLAVALAAQRRDQVAVGVEVADVHVAQVHVVDRHVAAHVHAFGARLFDQRQPGGGRQAGDVQAGAGGACELEIGEQRHRFGRDRDAGQTEPGRHLAVVGVAQA